MGDSRKTLAKNLRALIEAKGLTARDAAAAMEMPGSQLSQYLNEKQAPSIDALDRMAIALGTTASALLDDGRKPEVIMRDVEHPIEECARRWAEATLAAHPTAAPRLPPSKREAPRKSGEQAEAADSPQPHARTPKTPRG